uniref:Uncharacterized protein n=1 Tax=Opuntia streptacantha TaxID=393608 RepID=A0A7C9AVC9_OPUST
MGPSAASYPFEKYRAPANFRLQLDAWKLVPTSHVPFHVSGTGPIPLSSKLLLSGQTPVSSTPTTTSPAVPDSVNISGVRSSPRNDGVRVVWSSYLVSGKTDKIPGRPERDSASSSVSRVAYP